MCRCALDTVYNTRFAKLANPPLDARLLEQIPELPWHPGSVEYRERSKPIFVMSYMSLLNEKVDLLRILYDRSPVGIVAAVPIMDGKRTTDDARVLTMNSMAREILRLPE